MAKQKISLLLYDKERKSVWETRMQTHMREEECSREKRDDVRCDGLNGKNKGGGEQKRNRKIKLWDCPSGLVPYSLAPLKQKSMAVDSRS